MNANLKNVKAIFLEAVEKHDRNELSLYLEEACAGNQELRQQVEVLLEAHAGGESLLDKGAFAVDETLVRPIIEQPGDTIGPYKLLQQIGEGGMGTVFMAEQTEPVERRVALKIIKPGMDTQQVIARFEAERQALAMMDHPNIAKVLDAGTTDTGRSYFVMELFKGVPITDYCDEQHLTPKERLELFIPICQAVQHAHQKGIIHRDLKPTNILVAQYDNKPVPKVIDFGVAKAISHKLTEKTMFTQYGQIVGTVEYMSPEQARFNHLDVDTRSDVYSLGVLLYELLTGETPFDKERLRSAAFDELLRILREEEPPKPSLKLSSSQSLPSIAANRQIDPKKLSTLVRGDLDWIVMKALEKDRNRRYETTSQFAEDVQHYLNDEAVTACPPSAAYRFRKFARRNKTVIGMTAVIVVSALIVAGSLGWMARDRALRHARLSTQLDVILADADRLMEEQNWPEALAAAKRAEAALGAGEANPGLRRQVNDLLKDLQFVDRLEQIRSDFSIAFDAVGTPYGHVADEQYARAFAEYGVDVVRLPVETSIARLSARPEFSILIAAALDNWAYARRISPAEDSLDWQGLVEVARGLDADRVRNQLRSISGQKASPELQAELRRLVESIDISAQHPETLRRLGQTLASVELLDDAVEVLHKARSENPQDFWLNFDLGSRLARQQQYEQAVRFYTAAVAIRPNAAPAHLNLGGVLVDQGKLAEAEAEFRKTIFLKPDFAGAHYNLGNVLKKQGKLPEAEDEYRKAIRLKSNYAEARVNLGNLWQQQGKLVEAEAEFREAIRIKPDLVQAHHNLGNALMRQGRFDEAVVAYREATRLEPENAGAYSDLGNALSEMGRHIEALDAHNQAIKLNPEDGCSYHNLGRALEREGNLDAAIDAYEESVRLHDQHADHFLSLGFALANKGLWDRAIAAYREAIELDPTDAKAHYHLGNLYADQGKRTKAEQCYLEALKLEPTFACAHNNLGKALGNQGQLEEAIVHFRKAIDVDPKYVHAHYNLGLAFYKKGEFENAIAPYHKAIELDPKYVDAHHKLGVVLHKKGEFDEAIVHWRRAMELDPDGYGRDAGLHTNIAWRLATAPDPAKRDPVEAVKHAQRAVELKPENANHWSNLGVAEYRAGNWPEAFDALQRADQMRDGKDNYHRFFLAMACYRTGRHDEAKKHYVEAARWLDRRQERGSEPYRFREEAEELMAITPEDRSVLILQSLSEDIAEAPAEAARWAARARFHVERQAWDESAADWIKVIELSDDNLTWTSPRKIACFELAGRPEVFQRAVKLRPDESALWIGRAQYRALRSQWDQAADDYAQAFASRPVSDETVFEYATALLLAGNVDEYQRVCSKVAAHAAESDDSFAAFVAARTCGIGPADDIDPRQLVDWAAKRLQDDEQPWVLHVLGLAQYRAGEFDRTIGSLTATNAGDWGTAQVQNDLVLAMAHYRLGHLDEAQTFLRQANKKIKTIRPRDAGEPAKEQVIDWIAMEALRREAERLIESSVNHQKESAASERSR